MLMGKALTRTAGLFPDKTAIIGENATFTYREFNSRVNRLAWAVTELGLAKGDKAAILAKNCPEYLETYHALAKAGVWMVPINHRLKPSEISYRLDHSESSLLVIEPEFAGVLKQLAPSVMEQLKGRVLVLGTAAPPNGLLSYEAALANGKDVEPDVELHHEDTLFLGYTGGTTGRSKAAVISNRAIVVGYLYKHLEYGYDRDEVALYPGPFWHTAPRNCCLAFYLGGTVVVSRGFTPRGYLEMVQRYGVTSSFLVPTMYKAILDLPDHGKYDTSSLRVLNSGGGPMPVELKRRVMERFGPILYEHYASTETLILCTIGGREMLERPTSVGRPVYDVHLELLDDEGKQVTQGEVGEIYIKGPSLFNGYYKDEEKTRQAMKGGWFTLGDMGRFDEEGYLYIVDRKADMVISGGENIYPKEVEEVLQQHPSVSEVAVVGVPDEHWGESLKALIVLNNGLKVSEQDLLEFCTDRLADYLKPKSIEFVDDLPRSPMGKVLKRKIRERYWNGREVKV
jgi:acyl-CoA synthetase (AMP-forming)/AMP-acid ligase II